VLDMKLINEGFHSAMSTLKHTQSPGVKQVVSVKMLAMRYFV
jgi:hypothetical protein